MLELPSPIGNGWEMVEGLLTPCFMTKDPHQPVYWSYHVWMQKVSVPEQLFLHQHRLTVHRGLCVHGKCGVDTCSNPHVLQKKAIRIMTFSNFREHSSPLFKLLNIIKLKYLVTLHALIFMYQYHNHLLPSSFDTFFTSVIQIHSYNTRTASKQSYYPPYVKINYGKCNIIFLGPQIWNCIKLM